MLKTNMALINRYMPMIKELAKHIPNNKWGYWGFDGVLFGQYAVRGADVSQQEASIVAVGEALQQARWQARMCILSSSEDVSDEEIEYEEKEEERRQYDERFKRQVQQLKDEKEGK